ncbi:MAG: hypothetical protein ACI4XM_05120 [Candidatus Coprovivens sp.]
MNKKIKIIIVILLFITTLSSGCLLTKIGITRSIENRQKLQNEKNNKKIEELEKEKETLINEEENLKQEQLKEYNTIGKTTKYTELTDRINKIEEDILKIDFEISKTKNGYYDNASGRNETLLSSLLLVTPGIILIIGSVIIIIFGLKKISK